MRRSRTALMTIGVLLALALGVAACGGSDEEGGGGSTAAAGGGSVAVALGTADNEYALVPDPAEIAAGSVSFDVTNGGTIEHEMVVVKTDKGAANLAVGEEADETGAVDEIVLPAGEAGNLTVDLAAGKYALICNLPGHYAAGMYADFTVK